MESLNAISPVDGRYRKQVDALGGNFSEAALIRYRVRVEIEYFISLCDLPLPQLENFDKSLYPQLRDIYLNFSTEDALEVKEIEKTTNHDVKAVEYFIKRRFDKLGIQDYKEFVHFGLTSQDINNTSVPLSIKECHENTYYPMLEKILSLIEEKAYEWKDIPMLAHTHGQPASPTTLGKEMMVFAYRMKRQMEF
ncbi:MAG: adenylosuccinate lyase, partial [Bacteroidales bacterium]|nr:adenylosuccinate lyase [Bacteroidales bacterium]